ncbi:MAG: ABC transporter permease [Acidobacteriaceae bacterium]|nr:ABC transporter permease [Acidobacteriaceae bacterium]
MINKLVIENLRHRWVRTLLSALVVGVQVMSILTLIGLSHGLLQQSAERAKGTGADIFLKPDTHGTFSFSQGQINEKFVAFVAKQPHVTQAAGVLSVPIEIVNTLNGVNFPEFARLNNGIHFIAGAPPRDANDMLVDEYYAKQHDLHPGDTVNLLNHNWHLSGIIEGGVLGRFIVPLPTLQVLTGNAQPPRISEILVKLDNPALTNQQVASLNRLLKGDLQAISVADFVSQFNINNIPQLQAFIAVVTTLAVIVGFLVVFLSMYTAVVERTREIGILKALGAKPLTVLDILVREACVLAIAGWIIGILLTYGARGIIMATIPASLPVVNVPEWWPIAAAIAIAGALLGAIYPGFKAARQDPIEALAYE